MNSPARRQPEEQANWEIGWELRATNGVLRKRRKQLGWTQARLGAAVSKSGDYIGKIELLKLRPDDETRSRLAQILNCGEQEIWPDWLEPRQETLRAVAYQSITAQEFSALDRQLAEQVAALPSPDTQSDADRNLTIGEVRAGLELAMKTMTYREREVIKLRYGLNDGFFYTYEEVARIFQVSKERIRQIERRAIVKLRHPTRSKIFEKPAMELLEGE